MGEGDNSRIAVLATIVALALGLGGVVFLASREAVAEKSTCSADTKCSATRAAVAPAAKGSNKSRNNTSENEDEESSNSTPEVAGKTEDKGRSVTSNGDTRGAKGAKGAKATKGGGAALKQPKQAAKQQKKQELTITECESVDELATTMETMWLNKTVSGGVPQPARNPHKRRLGRGERSKQKPGPEKSEGTAGGAEGGAESSSRKRNCNSLGGRRGGCGKGGKTINKDAPLVGPADSTAKSDDASAIAGMSSIQSSSSRRWVRYRRRRNRRGGGRSGGSKSKVVGGASGNGISISAPVVDVTAATATATSIGYSE